MSARAKPEPRGRQAELSRIISAAFSAIIMVGALVLPLVTDGIIEASTTRSPWTPNTRSCGSTTALDASGPIRAEHDG